MKGADGGVSESKTKKPLESNSNTKRGRDDKVSVSTAEIMKAGEEADRSDSESLMNKRVLELAL